MTTPLPTTLSMTVSVTEEPVAPTIASTCLASIRSTLCEATELNESPESASTRLTGCPSTPPALSMSAMASCSPASSAGPTWLKAPVLGISVPSTSGPAVVCGVGDEAWVHALSSSPPVSSSAAARPRPPRPVTCRSVRPRPRPGRARSERPGASTTRMSIDDFWIQRNASASDSPCLACSTALARSTSLRVSSRSARSATSRVSAAICSCRATAISIAGTRSAFWNGLTRYAIAPGVPGPLDQLALGERGQHQHGRELVRRDPLGRGDAVEDRHLHVEHDQVGARARAARRTAVSPSPASPTTA